VPSSRDRGDRMPVVVVGAGPAGLAAAASPTTVAAVPQDHLEPVLLRHLRGLPAAEVRFGAELVGFDQDPDGVTVVLADRATGAERRVAAAYLVGADGAHSRVRARLGVAMDGPDHLAEHLTALVEAPLGEVVGDRRYGIYHLRHPEAAGVLVPNGGRHRWLYGRAWDPGRERLEDYTDERLAGLVRTAAGADLPVRIIAKGAFSFAARWPSATGPAAPSWSAGSWPGCCTGGRARRCWTATRPSGARWAPAGPSGRAQDGPEPDGAEALAEDLRGRLPHAWLDPARTRSTLDLLGPGLTLLTGPHGHAWPHAAAAAHPPSPSTSTPSTPALRSPSPSPPTARS
jgi:putative polyketide hydroxylase